MREFDYKLLQISVVVGSYELPVPFTWTGPREVLSCKALRRASLRPVCYCGSYQHLKEVPDRSATETFNLWKVSIDLSQIAAG